MAGSTNLEDSLSEALSKTKQRSAEISGSEDVEEFKKEVRRLNDRVRELEEANGGGKILVEEENYSDLDENDLKKQVDRLEISQAVSESDIDERMEEFRDELFEEVFSSIENRLAEENFRKIVNSIRSDADRRMDKIVERIENQEIEEKVDRDELEHRIEEEREEIDNSFEFRFNSTTDEIDSVRKNMDALRSDLSKIHNSIDDLRQDLEELENESHELETELRSDLEKSREKIEEKLEHVPAQDDFEELKSKVNDLSTLLERLSEKIVGV